MGTSATLVLVKSSKTSAQTGSAVVTVQRPAPPAVEGAEGLPWWLAGLATAMLMSSLTGCASKTYVRAQTAPIVQETNRLDEQTAANRRSIVDTDRRAQTGIAGAQSAAEAADDHALAAGRLADTAGANAEEAYHRVDTLRGVVANLDNYRPLAGVSVTFGFDQATLTADDKAELDGLAEKMASARGFILQLTGGTDAIGDANYNYQLSQRRADAVAAYLQVKYNVPPHKFYLVGIGKDLPVASDRTAAGRAKNRRVEVQLLSNMTSAKLSGSPS